MLKQVTVKAGEAAGRLLQALPDESGKNAD